jgi:hypothetical protein
MPAIDPDDPDQSIVYRYCERGEQCPDYREGLEHAHGRAETRGADVTPPLRNTQPTVPDVRA